MITFQSNFTNFEKLPACYSVSSNAAQAQIWLIAIWAFTRTLIYWFGTPFAERFGFFRQGFPPLENRNMDIWTQRLLPHSPTK